MAKRPKKTPWWEKESTTPRHYEDQQLRDEVAAILSVLPEEHSARRALADGAPTLEAQRLLDEVNEADIVRRIGYAYEDWQVRLRSKIRAPSTADYIGD